MLGEKRCHPHLTLPKLSNMALDGEFVYLKSLTYQLHEVATVRHHVIRGNG